MKIKELETLLDGGTETQTLDFKESCPWNTDTFAKDILAMANVDGGGRMVIGVAENDDGSYTRKGIRIRDKKTYLTDNIMDSMSAFADPYVSVSANFTKDKKEIEYCILSIEPFKEVPVICKKDSTDTHKGEIYYRNRDGRIKSARVSNSHDMRDIIDRAVIKSAKRAQSIGFILPEAEQINIAREAVKRALKEEIKDL